MAQPRGIPKTAKLAVVGIPYFFIKNVNLSYDKVMTAVTRRFGVICIYLLICLWMIGQ